LLRADNLVARSSTGAPERRVDRRVKCGDARIDRDFLEIRALLGVLRRVAVRVVVGDAGNAPGAMRAGL
jgi:hypothetical protein